MNQFAQMVRDRLAIAFAALEEKGYFTAMDHTCCNTCGWYEVPEDKQERAVFFHQQAADTLEATGDCYLNWDGDMLEIRAALLEAGLAVKHDGTENTKFIVRIPESVN